MFSGSIARSNGFGPLSTMTEYLYVVCSRPRACLVAIYAKQVTHWLGIIDGEHTWNSYIVHIGVTRILWLDSIEAYKLCIYIESIDYKEVGF
jgi:hypothetical protein